MRKLAITVLSLVLMTLSCVEKEKKAVQAEKPLETLTNSFGMSFVKIPAGTFQMGAPESDKDGGSDEKPVHTVTLTQDFYMSQYEITVGQFKEFLEISNLKMDEKYYEINIGEDNCPVAGVKFTDVMEFIKWLNDYDIARNYRLPTEAEWEYASRAGSQDIYYFGNDEIFLKRHAWYWNNSNKKIHPVGMKMPNSFGLYDMYGNVYEWTSDWYSPDYYSLSPEIDPQGPETGSKKVYRGGGYLCNPDYCRSSFRNYGPPEKCSESVGFRLIMSEVNPEMDVSRTDPGQP